MPRDNSIKKVLVIKPLLDSKLQYMHRDKNNLVSIKDMLANYGSTILRLYYATLGLDDDNNSFDYVEVDAIKELVDKITKLFYFPIDDSCSDLDDEYEKMVFDCKRCAKENDFRSYLENIIFFVNKVYTVHHISRTQAKGLLIILSVLTPALAEKIKEDVLNLKEPLLYYSWPEN